MGTFEHSCQFRSIPANSGRIIPYLAWGGMEYPIQTFRLKFELVPAGFRLFRSFRPRKDCFQLEMVQPLFSTATRLEQKMKKIKENKNKKKH